MIKNLIGQEVEIIYNIGSDYNSSKCQIIEYDEVNKLLKVEQARNKSIFIILPLSSICKISIEK